MIFSKKKFFILNIILNILYYLNNPLLFSMETDRVKELDVLQDRLAYLKLDDFFQKIENLPVDDSKKSFDLNIPDHFCSKDCLLLFSGINYSKFGFDYQDILDARRYGLFRTGLISFAISEFFPNIFYNIAMDEEIINDINKKVLDKINSLSDPLKRKLKKFYINFYDDFIKKTKLKLDKLSNEYLSLERFFESYYFSNVPFISTSTSFERSIKYALGSVFSDDNDIRMCSRAGNLSTKNYFGKVFVLLIPIEDLDQFDLNSLRIDYANIPDGDVSGTAFKYRYLVADHEVLFSSFIPEKYIIGQFDAKVPFNYSGSIDKVLISPFYKHVKTQIYSSLSDKKIRPVYHQLNGSFGETEPSNKDVCASRTRNKR